MIYGQQNGKHRFSGFHGALGPFYYYCVNNPSWKKPSKTFLFTEVQQDTRPKTHRAVNWLIEFNMNRVKNTQTSTKSNSSNELYVQVALKPETPAVDEPTSLLSSIEWYEPQ